MVTVVFALLVLQSSPSQELEEAVGALKAFRAEEGLQLLERVRAQRALRYTDNVVLHEQLGVAFAYLGRSDEAFDAFVKLMAIAPRHAISYTLSPRVTFVYERARQVALSQAPSTLELAWPRDTFATEPLKVELSLTGHAVKVAAVALFVRSGSSTPWSRFDLQLDDGLASVVLPPLRPDEPLTRQLYAVGLDAAGGNEVLQMGDVTRPREITLKVDSRPSWYQHWWVWALTAAVVAGVTIPTVVVATRAPPATVPTTFSSSF